MPLKKNRCPRTVSGISLTPKWGTRIAHPSACDTLFDLIIDMHVSVYSCRLARPCSGCSCWPQVVRPEPPRFHVQMFESCISLQLNNRQWPLFACVLYEPVRTEKYRNCSRSCARSQTTCVCAPSAHRRDERARATRSV